MTVNGRVRLDDIRLDDIVAEARAWTLPVGAARETAFTTIRALADAGAGLDAPALLAETIASRADALLAG